MKIGGRTGRDRASGLVVGREPRTAAGRRPARTGGGERAVHVPVAARLALAIGSILLALSIGACDRSDPGDASAPASGHTDGLAWEAVGEGTPLVLVHGSNLDRRLWDDEVERLRSRHRVVRYDVRGHGESDLPSEPYTAAEDLARVLDAAGVDRAAVVGLSDGARIAVDFALAHPRRTERLALLAPTVSGYEPREPPAFFRALGDRLRAGDLDGANRVLLESPVMRVPDGARERVRRMVEGNRRLWTADPSWQEAPTPPAIERLHEVDVPVLILVGDEDMPDIRAQARLLETRLPDARLVRVPEGGHLLNLTSPEAVRRQLDPFLAGAPSPGEPEAP